MRPLLKYQQGSLVFYVTGFKSKNSFTLILL
nr:MAG TPA: aminopeptidase [Caudoviricetes sp.]